MNTYVPYAPKTPMWPSPVYNEAGKCTHVYGVPVAELRRVLASIDKKEKHHEHDRTQQL